MSFLDTNLAAFLPLVRITLNSLVTPLNSISCYGGLSLLYGLYQILNIASVHSKCVLIRQTFHCKLFGSNFEKPVYVISRISMHMTCPKVPYIILADTNALLLGSTLTNLYNNLILSCRVKSTFVFLKSTFVFFEIKL